MMFKYPVAASLSFEKIYSTIPRFEKEGTRTTAPEILYQLLFLPPISLIPMTIHSRWHAPRLKEKNISYLVADRIVRFGFEHHLVAASSSYHRLSSRHNRTWPHSSDKLSKLFIDFISTFHLWPYFWMTMLLCLQLLTWLKHVTFAAMA